MPPAFPGGRAVEGRPVGVVGGGRVAAAGLGELGGCGDPGVDDNGVVMTDSSCFSSVSPSAMARKRADNLCVPLRGLTATPRDVWYLSELTQAG